MIVVSSVIMVITAISVYDHYSEKNWQEVTSSERNDVVFENRNKNYGAFQIRRHVEYFNNSPYCPDKHNILAQRHCNHNAIDGTLDEFKF